MRVRARTDGTGHGVSFLEQFRPNQEPLPDPDPSPGRGAWEPTAYARAALNAEVANVLSAPEGTRNDALNKAAFNLAQLISGGQISAELVTAELTAAGAKAGLLQRETANTIRSGLARGGGRARTAPERPLAAPQRPEQAAEGDPYPTVDWDAVAAGETDLEWILEPIIPAGRLVALFSPPKMGKSLFVLDMALKIAAGTEALGAPTKPTKILYLDFENDPGTDIWARVQDMGHTVEDIKRLAYMSYPACPPMDTDAGGEWVLQAARFHQAEMVVIDTISRCIQGEENDNNTWLNWYKHTGLRLKREGIACLRLDHTGKDEQRGPRGGSAKNGDIDASWKLSEIIKGQAYRLDCEYHRYPCEDSINITRTAFPTAHNPTTDSTKELKRDSVYAAIDEAGLDHTASRRQYGQAVRARGIRIGDKQLMDLVRERWCGLVPPLV